jgi:hypothetical protein
LMSKTKTNKIKNKVRAEKVLNLQVDVLVKNLDYSDL